MAAKKLQIDSKLNEADLDGDGVVTDAELRRHERIIDIDNKDKKEDAQRNMAWFALAGMILYPFAVIMAELVGMGAASSILGDMASVYFVSVAAIVAAFYAKEGYVSRSNNDE